MFPNAEKAQWLNKIVKQLWPIVKNYIHDIAKDLLEAKLNKKIKKYGLSGLTVEKLVLGSTVRFFATNACDKLLNYSAQSWSSVIF